MILNLVNNHLSDVRWKRIDFPDGHIHVDLSDTLGKIGASTNIVIKTRIKTYDDIFVLKQVMEQCRQVIPDTPFSLWCTYLLAARYDRPMHDYDSFDLKIVCDDLMSLDFKRIQIVEPHSPITATLLHPCSVVHPLDNALKHCLTSQENVCIVTPDLGAVKRVEQYLLGKKLNYPIVYANKHRNLATGEIIGLQILNPEELTQNVVIYDDLCDGGRTFTEVAKLLRATGIVKKIILLVPQGLFSKGTDILLTPNAEGSYVDEIYTTNAYRDDLIDNNDNFHVIAVI